MVWLSHAKGRAWSCESCSPIQRRLRGNCGGPFKKGVKHGLEDEQGRIYVPAYRVAPDCDPEWGEYNFYSCPVAGANQSASVLNYYKLTKYNMMRIVDIIPNPTPALTDALSTLNHASELREIRIRKQMEDKNG